jgi:hypothetical protein
VPILIFGADIKLNVKLSLRRSPDVLVSSHQRWRSSGLLTEALGTMRFTRGSIAGDPVQ